jgi:quinol monooxygenase YgiN
VIIVTGSVSARPDTIDEVQRISLEHVQRSRLEPGCLLHSVHRDVEDDHRFVFIEHWADRDALTTHFHVPESRAFATRLGELGAEPPTMEIYTVEKLGR